ncbi:MAG: threonylcarbamoyl-AMP synthase [Desulfobacterales bacterium C00003060]|nr:MAG: threonylcarbamoyl-AMP synthase [Desulfobacterales bacterium S3730MH5]OEU79856.1 MAG: threonylcarbamoyl-AMP synthase [Desulfobacterales bacterium S5133MH4]OEU80587.1 MAG: threonylcarbamoyl-AMP synthase [Desulfobacterales bacterium C00003060]
MKDCKILSVHPKSPNRGIIGKAAALVKKGGLVVFPTSSFYGLGTDAFNAETLAKVFRIKNRDLKKPLLILIAGMAELAPLVRSIPKTATLLIEAFWPGELTLVFHAADLLPCELTGDTEQIGIRLAAHPVACSLVKAVGGPITGTSANLSGKGGCTAVTQMDHQITDQVDLVLDAGTLGEKKESTVVDVTVTPPKILRSGMIDAKRIWTALQIER